LCRRVQYGYSIDLIEKIIVFNISLFILNIFGYDIDDCSISDFTEMWGKLLQELSDYFDDDSIDILKKMHSKNYNEIPHLTDVYNKFAQIV
jgi:hypothetical protein